MPCRFFRIVVSERRPIIRTSPWQAVAPRPCFGLAEHFPRSSCCQSDAVSLLRFALFCFRRSHSGVDGYCTLVFFSCRRVLSSDVEQLWTSCLVYYTRCKVRASVLDVALSTPSKVGCICVNVNVCARSVCVCVHAVCKYCLCYCLSLCHLKNDFCFLGLAPVCHACVGIISGVMTTSSFE